ncbi:hypothetical protein PoB_003867200 [Plakobranchus ocellatus]|uniref:Uncharacterized protein n=1 Tax=Plakobranchus ocellatus TaxID=259542 RepID=A0AAV4AZ49_9GAST|nr:hypothetical protein PoB_003867200 [Plakobranchus ocellatus]
MPISKVPYAMRQMLCEELEERRIWESPGRAILPTHPRVLWTGSRSPPEASEFLQFKSQNVASPSTKMVHNQHPQSAFMMASAINIRKFRYALMGSTNVFGWGTLYTLTKWVSRK